MLQKERWNGWIAVLLGKTMNALYIDMFYGVRCECIHIFAKGNHETEMAAQIASWFYVQTYTL